MTKEVEHAVAKSGIKKGLCSLFVPHATAAITINENADPNVGIDILEALKRIAPKGAWKHDAIDRNGDSHIKSSIIGASQTIPIREGRLCLGQWQDIFLCEFDGPRKRKVIITIIASE
ncbi:MAG: secondary thiamine-phosphate synthase enzyme YjbQ [Nanoarchaeota archaeon]|nr:secondary thiamine-phosphate synthase enzyme YjbQ [Nanoarchaeota archaeon]